MTQYTAPAAVPGPHLLVTRSAALEYQVHVGGGFEKARRALTLDLIAAGLQDVERTSYHVSVPAVPMTLRVWVQREGPLLVAVKAVRL